MDNQENTHQASTAGVPQPPSAAHQQPYVQQTQLDQYSGWLVSNSLIKRSFAVLGHNLVANLIITIPFLLIGMLSALA
jgi:hypothetical protein